MLKAELRLIVRPMTWPRRVQSNKQQRKRAMINTKRLESIAFVVRTKQ